MNKNRDELIKKWQNTSLESQNYLTDDFINDVQKILNGENVEIKKDKPDLFDAWLKHWFKSENYKKLKENNYKEIAKEEIEKLFGLEVLKKHKGNKNG